MLYKPIIRLVLLWFVAFGVGCDGGDVGVGLAGNTEVNLLISDPATPPDELAFSVDFVSYRITCLASGLVSYDDSADLTGNFEIVDSRDPPVWTLVTDLPPSPCTITLWVFYEDEVVCSGTQSLTIVEDGDPSTTNKVDIVIECTLSTNPPTGDSDIDGSFTFINGNYCPQLIWLGAHPSVIDPNVPSVTTIQTYSFDLDNTCGQNCDPQTCDFSTNPPTCTRPPDPGFTSTLFTPSGVGTFADPNSFETIFACDPLLPGPVEICAWVTDGDIECDKHRCITVVCPDLCENVVCDDGNECTRDRCDPLNGLCSNDVAPDGIACNSCGSTCQSGACTGAPFTADIEFNGTATLSGTMQQYNATLVNPYSGASVAVSGAFRVNDLSYKGTGTADILSGILPGGTQSEVLLIKDLIHAQTVCGVETLTTLNGFDVMFLADDFIVLQNMVIDGGTNGDFLWANAGDDTVRGNLGDDFIDGGPGDDMIQGGLGDDTITLWPGSGFDSVSGDLSSGNFSITDRVEIYAIQSQILITPAANPSYEFDIFYLGIPMAQIMEVEFLDMNDASIDLSTCTGGPSDVCNLCGNDDLNGGEGCDDGNNVSGDGCTATCVAEY